MTETNFVAHYGYIFRKYFLIPLMLVGFLLIMVIPFNGLYYHKSILTTLSIIIVFLLVSLVIFLPIFIKNKSSLTLNSSHIIIKYPFSTNKKIISIAWNDIFSIEKDNKNKVIYIITKDKDIYALDQNLWYRSTEYAALTNPLLEESELYQAFSQCFSISEVKNIDYSTYKNNFSTFYSHTFAVIFIPFFIISCVVFYNYNDLSVLKTRNFLSIISLLFSSSLLLVFILSFLKIKDIRYIEAIFTKSVIFAIYLTGIIICGAHQYSIDNIKPQAVTYKLKESSDYRQIWTTEENLPDIFLYSHSYPQYQFLHQTSGTKHNFRIIHGLLDSYDVVNTDIEAVLSKKQSFK